VSRAHRCPDLAELENVVRARDAFGITLKGTVDRHGRSVIDWHLPETGLPPEEGFAGNRLPNTSIGSQLIEWRYSQIGRMRTFGQ
jgi:hypothetical protein